MERKNAWNPEQDEYLAAVVIQHIKSGSTQLKAFEEVAEHLGRTASACGFRFNSVVRKQYEEDIKAAKEAKQRNTTVVTSTPQGNNETEKDKNKEIVIISANASFAKSDNEIDAAESLDKVKSYIGYLETENKRLHAENERLKTQKYLSEPDEDLTALISILERARMSGKLDHLFGNKAM